MQPRQFLVFSDFFVRLVIDTTFFFCFSNEFLTDNNKHIIIIVISCDCDSYQLRSTPAAC